MKLSLVIVDLCLSVSLSCTCIIYYCRWALGAKGIAANWHKNAQNNPYRRMC